MMQEISMNDTLWIEELALQEVNMDQSGIVHFNHHISPQSLLEESSINMMEEMRELFEVYVHKFNQNILINESQRQIKIYKISGTVNDFMLFRNSLKLILARKSADNISIGFLSHSGGLYSARLNSMTPAENVVHEIQGSLGAFNEVKWRFRGEPVNINALVRHYLTEFIKLSAR
jgi:hypothetical protein